MCVILCEDSLSKKILEMGKLIFFIFAYFVFVGAFLYLDYKTEDAFFAGGLVFLGATLVAVAFKE